MDFILKQEHLSWLSIFFATIFTGAEGRIWINLGNDLKSVVKSKTSKGFEYIGKGVMIMLSMKFKVEKE